MESTSYVTYYKDHKGRVDRNNLRLEIDGHELGFNLGCDDDTTNVELYLEGEIDHWFGSVFNIQKHVDHYCISYTVRDDLDIITVQRNALNDEKMNQLANEWLRNFKRENPVNPRCRFTGRY